MRARFNGTCQCGHDYNAGASITRRQVEGKWVTLECPICNPDEHAEEHAPSGMLELRVRVQRVRFVKPDGSRTIVDALLDGPPPADSPLEEDRPFPVIGKLGKVELGDLLEVRGNFQHDAQWGWQFIAQRSIPVVAGTDQALRAFLARFPNVGQKRAEQILQRLGSREAVIHALEKEPLRLTVVAGITEARAKEIGQAYRDLAGLRESAMFLAGLELGEELTAQILDEYGADAKTVLVEDPYQLMELRGVGFKRADDVARRLSVSKDDPRRLAAAVLFLMHEVEDQGHTYATINDLLAV